MSIRRLIEMIGGRAAADDTNPLVSFAARPQVVRALQRATLVVAGTGVVAVLLLGLGGSVMSAAAEAAASAGGGGGGGSGSRADATVSEQAATTPVAAIPATIETVVSPAASQLPLDQVGDLTGELTGIVSPSALAEVPPLTSSPGATPPGSPPTTAPPPPQASLPAGDPPDPGSVQAIILEIFGEHGQAAIGVARCESGLNPAAISRGGGNWGLFQINTVHRGRVAQMGYQWEDLLDARVNSLVAHSIFSEQGWRPWGCRHAAY